MRRVPIDNLTTHMRTIAKNPRRDAVSKAYLMHAAEEIDELRAQRSLSIFDRALDRVERMTARHAFVAAADVFHPGLTGDEVYDAFDRYWTERQAALEEAEQARKETEGAHTDGASYLDARGAVEGTEPAEDVIRRIRGAHA